MSNLQGPNFFTVDNALIDFSLIDIFVLQRMAFLKEPTIRYQIMQDILNYFPEISTSKIYRILDKFEKNDLVIVHNGDTPKFELSNKGFSFIKNAKAMLNRFGFDVFTYFEKEFPRFIKFIETNIERMLLLDSKKIIDIRFMKFLAQEPLNLHVVYPEKNYQYFKRNFDNIKRTIIVDNIIKEPDNFFDRVLLYVPNVLTTNLIDELYRIIKPKGKLVITTMDVIKQDHFVHNILVEQFAPPMLKRKIEPLNFDLLHEDHWRLSDKLNIYGLNFLKYENIK